MFVFFLQILLIDQDFMMISEAQKLFICDGASGHILCRILKERQLIADSGALVV